MKRKQTILNLILILVLCFSFITPFVLPQPVLAAEEEEEDNFTTMPNYRWENQSTIDSAVSERLIGDQYEISNANNETSASTQKFAKSRELNSRDFYYESRFALDVGGNQTEYFRDELGDACDFEEGDAEGFSKAEGDEVLTVIDGLMSVQVNDDNDGLHLHNVLNANGKVYTGVEFRARSTDDDLMLTFAWYTDTTTFLFAYFVNITTEWDVYEFVWSDTTYYQESDESTVFDDLRIYTRDEEQEYPNTIYYDYFKFIGDLDYATHVEDEIEDTWDWENSDEYWYVFENNVSDFNDGTTEGWDNYEADTAISNVDGWLEVGAIGSVQNLEINISSLSINSLFYQYLTIEVSNIGGAINSLTVYDSDSNQIGFDGQDLVSVFSKYLYNIDLDADADWSGIETGFILDWAFYGASSANKIIINMTYLYTVELGDIESHDGFDYQYVNPEGYWTGNPAEIDADAFRDTTARNIDTNLFNIVKLRVKSLSSDASVKIGGYWPEYFDLSDYVSVGTDWSIIEFVLSDDSDWIDICLRISFTFKDDVGNFDTNDYISIDYVLLLGHWSETDGFKFSLLNADDEEGMSFQFTGNSDNSYDISIDMYDSVGVALGYSYSFDYSLADDGWLRIRVDWHLDKKNVKILLEYDNGTDIINIRRITDLYGSNVGFSRLLLLEEGFPSLCLNNSIHAFARSYVIIDYIDADWKIVAWREPEGSVYTSFWGSLSSHGDHLFTAISPYGLTAYHKDRIPTFKFYRLTTDRFDGLSFDISLETSELDATAAGDWAAFVLSIYNIQANGSAMFIGEMAIVQYPAGSGGTSLWVCNRTGDEIQSSQVDARENIQLDFSFWHEDKDKSIMQFHFQTDTTFDVRKQISFGHEFTENFTQEYMFIVGYGYRTDDNGAADDEIDILMGGFELIRKDIIGDIVALIFTPIVDVLAIILSPLILLFQLLAVALFRGFKNLASALQPFFDILGAIFGSIIETLGGVISSALVTLGEYLELVFEELWALLWGLAEDFANFLMEVLAIIFVLMLALAGIIVELMMGILDWVWVNVLEASPLGFVIVIIVDVLVASPVIIMDIINLFLFWSFWIIIGVWIIVLPMQAAQSDSISEFFERVIGILCFDVVPIDIAGFGLWIPLAIPLIFFTCAEIIILV